MNDNNHHSAPFRQCHSLEHLRVITKVVSPFQGFFFVLYLTEGYTPGCDISPLRG